MRLLLCFALISSAALAESHAFVGWPALKFVQGRVPQNVRNWISTANEEIEMAVTRIDQFQKAANPSTEEMQEHSKWQMVLSHLQLRKKMLLNFEDIYRTGKDTKQRDEFRPIAEAVAEYMKHELPAYYLTGMLVEELVKEKARRQVILERLIFDMEKFGRPVKPFLTESEVQRRKVEEEGIWQERLEPLMPRVGKGAFR
jgi:hypothetical protein